LSVPMAPKVSVIELACLLVMISIDNGKGRTSHIDDRHEKGASV
jgi:hypothetical protein